MRHIEISLHPEHGGTFVGHRRLPEGVTLDDVIVAIDFALKDLGADDPTVADGRLSSWGRVEPV